jgi:ATP adenylyltransferase
VSFEQLWAGWRSAYVEKAADAARSGEGPEESACVLCRIVAAGEPTEGNGVVHRGEHALAVLNAYPYASGHLLVVPYRHEATFHALDAAERADLWEVTLQAVRAIERAYHPDGVNLGANLGRAAGAGVPGHVHLHVLPRWSGDTNFMTTVASVRVLPEALPVSWRRLVDAWPKPAEVA